MPPPAAPPPPAPGHHTMDAATTAATADTPGGMSRDVPGGPGSARGTETGTQQLCRGDGNQHPKQHGKQGNTVLPPEQVPPLTPLAMHSDPGAGTTQPRVMQMLTEAGAVVAGRV